jgi:ABC-2 type transport system permease protein
MTGTLTLTRAELRRLSRNKRYFFLTLAIPVVLYLLVGRSVKANVSGYGVDFHAYYMVGMAMFGAFSGALTGNSQRISQERKDGWIRQLRLTTLPANAYVVSKVLVSLATTIPAIVIVLLLGRFFGSVHLPAWQWLAIAVTIWFGATIFAALAVALGYRFDPDQVQPVAMIVYLFFAILGGLWFPLSGFLGNVGKVTPTYDAVKIATDVIAGLSVPAGYPVGLVVWLAIFTGLATVAVRATAETV